MKPRLPRDVVALRAAKEFKDGDCVNLGHGIGTLCSNFIPEDRTVIFHSENGVINYGHVLTEEEEDKADFDLVNASGSFVAPAPGMCFVDHATSLALVRRGRVDITVLGALEVSEKGDLANWTTTGLAGGTLGGAMDMPVGTKKVIVAMEHTTSKGVPKIVKRCKYPLTGKECVDLLVTDLAVIEVTQEGLLVKEIAPEWTIEEVQGLTEPKLLIAEDITEMTF